MPFHAIIAGIALIAIGGFGYMNATPDATGKVSPTALIPAFFGAALVLCGLIVSLKDSLRKHVMHVAALIGVLGVIGGFAPIIRAGEFDLNKPSILNGLKMTVVCAIFVGLCVKSFIDARKAREAAAKASGHTA
jgi:hypothetical protein